jgi:hypothetical protein
VKIRDAQDGDFAAIARMAQRSDLFVGELSEAGFPSMLAWLYVEAPSKIRLQFVAEHEEEVVAHYGAASIEYKLYDETCVAGFASNLVIDPDHRAGMLFISLQSYLQREYQKKNFRFVYGLVTRANVLEPHLRTGWKKIGMVPVYAKPFDFPAVAASALRHPLSRALAFAPLKAAESLWRVRWSRRSRTVSVDEAARFEADADRFLAEFTASLEIGAVRSREILNWRFAGYSERGYRLFVARQDGHVAGYVVTRRMPLKHLDALVLVDIAFDPARTEVGEALLRHCDREAMRAGVDVSAAIMNSSSPFAPYLRRFGYLKTPESFTLVVHAPRGAPGPPFAEALFPHWHVTWFDHDYV